MNNDYNMDMDTITLKSKHLLFQTLNKTDS